MHLPDSLQAAPLYEKAMQEQEAWHGQPSFAHALPTHGDEGPGSS